MKTNCRPTAASPHDASAATARRRRPHARPCTLQVQLIQIYGIVIYWCFLFSRDVSSYKTHPVRQSSYNAQAIGIAYLFSLVF